MTSSALLPGKWQDCNFTQGTLIADADKEKPKLTREIDGVLVCSSCRANNHKGEVAIHPAGLSLFAWSSPFSVDGLFVLM